MQYNVTNIFMPCSGLLNVLSIGFAGDLSTMNDGNNFLLVFVELLTMWPFVRATKTKTGSVVIQFM